MHHDNHLELHRQRTVDLYREAALMRMAHATPRRRPTRPRHARLWRRRTPRLGAARRTEPDP